MDAEMNDHPEETDEMQQERYDDVSQRLDAIAESIESIDRTLRGSEEEGSAGLLVRTVKLEAVQEEQSRTMYELRNEWKSFRRVVMVWALVALFSGAATGTVISNLIFVA